MGTLTDDNWRRRQQGEYRAICLGRWNGRVLQYKFVKGDIPIRAKWEGKVPSLGFQWSVSRYFTFWPQKEASLPPISPYYCEKLNYRTTWLPPTMTLVGSMFWSTDLSHGNPPPLAIICCGKSNGTPNILHLKTTWVGYHQRWSMFWSTDLSHLLQSGLFHLWYSWAQSSLSVQLSVQSVCSGAREPDNAIVVTSLHLPARLSSLTTVVLVLPLSVSVHINIFRILNNDLCEKM